ncbi:hypothetical protein [Fibrivirga algicola]|uniref:Uncharacterized protein n=1 Tax=Fibrivirga algicola TaxID=2950420 RepID=A0ABX0QJK2_9BACT|nr:hypothetical protein [Fibrivirga algicola]NID12605.1 hypothetical protein [Fibrivirga algicola]
MKNSNVSFYLGLVLSALVLLNLGLWIYAATRVGLSFEQARQTYLGYFPDFLQHPTLLTLLNVALCSLSLFLLIRMGESLSRLANLIRIPTVVINTILIAWNVFSLM